MVSTKVIVLALVLVACLIQVQGRHVRGAGAASATSGGSGSGDNIMNNFNQFFTKFSKNPSDFIIVISNFIKKGDSVSAS
ncbi:unnamed protein product [Colias eurytheme]|nr:unnamed protein product [Colias eurytheme]